MTALVVIEVHSPGGARARQQLWYAQPFAAGQPREFVLPWTAPADAAAGQYTVKVGAIESTALFHWNDDAVTFAVGTAPPQRVQP